MKKDTYGKDWSTPVLVLDCKLGALAIMRTLGTLGVPVFGVDEKQRSAELSSRYLKKSFTKRFMVENQQEYLQYLLHIAKIIGQKAVLIPTSDALSVFVAEHSAQLAEFYLFPTNSVELLDELADKKKMFNLATEYAVPTPGIICPQSIGEVESSLPNLTFPLMLKGIDGGRLIRHAGKKMAIVDNQAELLKEYELLDEPNHPNLMLQELIPGADDQIYIFNGYFDENSDCLAAFTGKKIRQYPVHVGCASVAECQWNETVSTITQTLAKQVGYKGIIDIGFKYDERDDSYKVLDINPRVGQAFRAFVAANNMDVVRSLYLDLTGQAQPEVEPVEGRRWIIEDYDLVSTYDYFCEGSLSVGEWFSSLRKVREGAWFSRHDPKPFLYKLKEFNGRLVRSTSRRLQDFASIPVSRTYLFSRFSKSRS
jgi:D-aspartate ligase